MLLRQACEKGVEAWIKQSADAKKALKEHTGKIIYKSTNYILGSGPVGSAKVGQNLVGKTLEKIRRNI